MDCVVEIFYGVFVGLEYNWCVVVGYVVFGFGVDVDEFEFFLVVVELG